MRLSVTFGLAMLCLILSGCQSDPSEFNLPEGDIHRGQQAFLDLKCNTCHRVDKLDLPVPTADPPVPVVLGGPVTQKRSDSEIVTEITNPSHRLALGYPLSQIQSGNLSRMPEYKEIMTVQQLSDLVTFLQSRFEVIPPAPLH